jgi:hypothetical protein
MVVAGGGFEGKNVVFNVPFSMLDENVEKNFYLI